MVRGGHPEKQNGGDQHIWRFTEADKARWARMEAESRKRTSARCRRWSKALLELLGEDVLAPPEWDDVPSAPRRLMLAHELLAS